MNYRCRAMPKNGPPAYYVTVVALAIRRHGREEQTNREHGTEELQM